MTPDRLPPPDRQFYHTLPSAEDKAKFLKLKETERQPFLEQKGLWAKWMELPPEEREAAKRGEVKAGYKEFTALMAWGAPADTQESKTPERTVRFYTFIRCTSGPRVGRWVASNPRVRRHLRARSRSLSRTASSPRSSTSTERLSARDRTSARSVRNSRGGEGR